MQEKILAKLEEYGLKESDLTENELKELQEEILAEEKGEIVLDGVLFHKGVFRYTSELK